MNLNFRRRSYRLSVKKRRNYVEVEENESLQQLLNLLKQNEEQNQEMEEYIDEINDSSKKGRKRRKRKKFNSPRVAHSLIQSAPVLSAAERRNKLIKSAEKKLKYSQILYQSNLFQEQNKKKVSISKRSMDDTDLLVNLHNSVVN